MPITNPDCSEWSEAIARLAFDIAHDAKISTVDGVVTEMQKDLPDMRRQTVVDAIVEATTRPTAAMEEALDEIKAIKSESKMDKRQQKLAENWEIALRDQIYPEGGVRKTTVDHGPAIRAAQELRDYRRKQFQESPAGRQRAQESRLKGRTKQLEASIAELKGHIAAGTVPVGKKKASLPDALQDMVDERDELAAELRQSEPAVIARIDQRIEKALARLEASDFAPTVRMPVERGSKQLEQKRFELRQLEHEIQTKIRELKPVTFWASAANIASIPKSLITSVDLSSIGRQGFFLGLAHPIRATRNLIPTLQAFASEQGRAKAEARVASNPRRALAGLAGVAITETSGGMEMREEPYRTTLAERIPIIGRLVLASERAYVTYLNLMRMETFTALVDGLSRNGEPTIDEAKAIANYVNVASGRGSIGELERATNFLNTVFFAPRYVASRFQFVIGQPLYKGTNATRKAIAWEYGKIASSISLLLGLSLLAGADVEDDPRSPDFLKIKIGNTRIDILAGVSQAIVFMAQLGTGKRKSSTTGRIVDLRGKEVPYGGDNVVDVIKRFTRYKLSPAAGAALNILSGEGPIGEKTTPVTVTRDFVVPLVMRDLVEAIEDQGYDKGTALGMAAIMGFGLNTYGGPPKAKAPMEDKEQYFKRIMAEEYRSGGSRHTVSKEFSQWAIKNKIDKKNFSVAKSRVRGELYDDLEVALEDISKKPEADRIWNRLRQLGATNAKIRQVLRDRAKKDKNK